MKTTDGEVGEGTASQHSFSAFPPSTGGPTGGKEGGATTTTPAGTLITSSSSPLLEPTTPYNSLCFTAPPEEASFLSLPYVQEILWCAGWYADYSSPWREAWERAVIEKSAEYRSSSSSKKSGSSGAPVGERLMWWIAREYLTSSPLHGTAVAGVDADGQAHSLRGMGGGWGGGPTSSYFFFPSPYGEEYGEYGSHHLFTLLQGGGGAPASLPAPSSSLPASSSTPTPSTGGAGGAAGTSSSAMAGGGGPPAAPSSHLSLPPQLEEQLHILQTLGVCPRHLSRAALCSTKEGFGAGTSMLLGGSSVGHPSFAGTHGGGPGREGNLMNMNASTTGPGSVAMLPPPTTTTSGAGMHGTSGSGGNNTSIGSTTSMMGAGNPRPYASIPLLRFFYPDQYWIHERQHLMVYSPSRKGGGGGGAMTGAGNGGGQGVYPIIRDRLEAERFLEQHYHWNSATLAAHGVEIRSQQHERLRSVEGEGEGTGNMNMICSSSSSSMSIVHGSGGGAPSLPLLPPRGLPIWRNAHLLGRDGRLGGGGGTNNQSIVSGTGGGGGSRVSSRNGPPSSSAGGGGATPSTAAGTGGTGGGVEGELVAAPPVAVDLTTPFGMNLLLHTHPRVRMELPAIRPLTPSTLLRFKTSLARALGLAVPPLDATQDDLCLGRQRCALNLVKPRPIPFVMPRPTSQAHQRRRRRRRRGKRGGGRRGRGRLGGTLHRTPTRREAASRMLGGQRRSSGKASKPSWTLGRGKAEEEGASMTWPTRRTTAGNTQTEKIRTGGVDGTNGGYRRRPLTYDAREHEYHDEEEEEEDEENDYYEEGDEEDEEEEDVEDLYEDREGSASDAEDEEERDSEEELRRRAWEWEDELEDHDDEEEEDEENEGKLLCEALLGVLYGKDDGTGFYGSDGEQGTTRSRGASWGGGMDGAGSLRWSPPSLAGGAHGLPGGGGGGGASRKTSTTGGGGGTRSRPGAPAGPPSSTSHMPLFVLPPTASSGTSASAHRRQGGGKPSLSGTAAGGRRGSRLDGLRSSFGSFSSLNTLGAGVSGAGGTASGGRYSFSVGGPAPWNLSGVRRSAHDRRSRGTFSHGRGVPSSSVSYPGEGGRTTEAAAEVKLSQALLDDFRYSGRIAARHAQRRGRRRRRIGQRETSRMVGHHYPHPTPPLPPLPLFSSATTPILRTPASGRHGRQSSVSQSLGTSMGGGGGGMQFTKSTTKWNEFPKGEESNKGTGGGGEGGGGANSRQEWLRALRLRVLATMDDEDPVLDAPPSPLEYTTSLFYMPREQCGGGGAATALRQAAILEWFEDLVQFARQQDWSALQTRTLMLMARSIIECLDHIEQQRGERIARWKRDQNRKVQEEGDGAQMRKTKEERRPITKELVEEKADAGAAAAAPNDDEDEEADEEEALAVAEEEEVEREITALLTRLVRSAVFPSSRNVVGRHISHVPVVQVVPDPEALEAVEQKWRSKEGKTLNKKQQQQMKEQLEAVPRLTTTTMEEQISTWEIGMEMAPCWTLEETITTLEFLTSSALGHWRLWSVVLHAEAYGIPAEETVALIVPLDSTEQCFIPPLNTFIPASSYTQQEARQAFLREVEAMKENMYEREFVYPLRVMAANVKTEMEEWARQWKEREQENRLLALTTEEYDRVQQAFMLRVAKRMKHNADVGRKAGEIQFAEEMAAVAVLMKEEAAAAAAAAAAAEEEAKEAGKKRRSSRSNSITGQGAAAAGGGGAGKLETGAPAGKRPSTHRKSGSDPRSSRSRSGAASSATGAAADAARSSSAAARCDTEFELRDIEKRLDEILQVLEQREEAMLLREQQGMQGNKKRKASMMRRPSSARK